MATRDSWPTPAGCFGQPSWTPAAGRWTLGPTSFFAVFVEAPPALAAALSIQRKFLARSWPDGHQVRIRIGLHAGRPTLTETGYVGIDVHTAVRVCSAGHGGQIVLSGEVRDALAGSEPAGVGFVDLGLHQLQGLPKPIALFQAEVDDLPSEFPPPRVRT